MAFRSRLSQKCHITTGELCLKWQIIPFAGKLRSIGEYPARNLAF